MKQRLLSIIRGWFKPQPVKLNDFIGEVFRIHDLIDEAKSIRDLDKCTEFTKQFAVAFKDDKLTAYHVPRLHTKILITRCEFLTQRYAPTE